MLVVPAIDLKDNRCVRLYQGDYQRETVFSDDPVAVARGFQETGAELIHVIDLSGAKEGKAVHRQLIKKILAAIEVPIEVGGGIRDIKTIEDYLADGVDRVILGTIACRKPELVREAARLFPQKIVVSLDVRGDFVAVEGWTTESEIHYLDLAKMLEDAGLRAIIFTDITRDGTEEGVNLKRVVPLLEAVSLPVYLAGGVSTIEDIKKLLPLEEKGLEGVITGRAIYTGSLDLKEAIKLAKGDL
ncbi:phosphoribosylformimino-5-aminoimidazole carboxamide ribotide isomerase [Thermodesulfatator indicus DSM 15286]|uniref:1-(5-phosphoribosyl)-5-[(5-phosphoribosylamino)methylideneamino] imidazole-4-carboxamide isomerase n=1 Tax=Thermodesulfatator indicus (strain DSM 15286 / JCM 11887 / CIR29812) TaxID=667014 RepID=F8A953_THEID|nr:1-(5-phosphoribosyl)-5-[(5-phosphoribosylamino)methylideneamino]imidazole-4-carboxamide isomerase [Thermodesulfatator indicus]AEH45181.1 phosphoribosylformimino-5-aminoimidazole carboxamide ribotide isomerase [Thermodesulfatator indicus DSM 15286]